MRLIVFDLDGTLIDSRRDLAESANEVLASYGAPALDEAAVVRMVGAGAATLVARAFAAVGRETPPDALARFLSIYDGRLLRHTRPYPGVDAALEALSVRARLAVLTNKPLHATAKILDGLNLARFFSADLVRGGDGPLGRKPDPSGLRALAATAGLPVSEAVLVGDSSIDWQTARAAGIPAWLARWGFGFDSVPLEDLTEADRVLDSPAELPGLLPP